MSSTDEDKPSVPAQYVDVVTREIMDTATAHRRFGEYSVGSPKTVRYRCDLFHRMPGLCGEYGLVNLKYRAVRTTHATRQCQKEGSRAGFNTPGALKRLPRTAQEQAPDGLLGSSSAAVACLDCSSDNAKPPVPDEQQQGGESEQWGSGWKKQKVRSPWGYEAVSLTPPESSSSTSPNHCTTSELSNHAGDSDKPSKEKPSAGSHRSSGSGEPPSDSAASKKRPCPSLASQSSPLEGAKQDKEEEGAPAKEEELPPTSEERWKGACFYSLSDALHATLLTMPHKAGSLKTIYEVLLRMRPRRIVSSYEKKPANRLVTNSLVSFEGVIDITATHNWQANIRTTFTRHKARFHHIPDSYGGYRLSAAAAQQVPPVIEGMGAPCHLPAPAPDPAPPASSDAAALIIPGLATDGEAPACAEEAAPAPKTVSAEVVGPPADSQLQDKQPSSELLVPKQDAPPPTPDSTPAPSAVPTVVPDVPPTVVPDAVPNAVPAVATKAVSGVVPDSVLDLDPAFPNADLSQMDMEALQDILGLGTEAFASPHSVPPPPPAPPATSAPLTSLHTLLAPETLLAAQVCSAPTPSPAVAVPVSPALGGPLAGLSMLQSSLDLWPPGVPDITTAPPVPSSDSQLQQLMAAHRGASEQLCAASEQLAAAQMLQHLTEQAIQQELQAQAARCDQELGDLDLPLLDLDDLAIPPADSAAQAPPTQGLVGPGLTQAIVAGALTQLGMGAMQCLTNGVFLYNNGSSPAEPDGVMEDQFYLRRMLTEQEPQGGSQLLQAVFSLLNPTSSQGQVPEEPLSAREQQVDFGPFSVRFDLFYIIFVMQVALVAVISLMALGFDVGLSSPKWELKIPSVAQRLQRLQQWGEAQCKSIRLLRTPGGAADLTPVIQAYGVMMVILCYVICYVSSLPNFTWAIHQLPMQGKSGPPYATLVLVTVWSLAKINTQPKWQAWVSANPYTVSMIMSFTASFSRCMLVESLSWVETPIVRIAMPALYCLLLLASCSPGHTREQMKYSVMILSLSGAMTTLWRACMHVGCWGYDGQQRDEAVLEAAMSVVLPLAVLYSHPTTITSAQASTAT